MKFIVKIPKILFALAFSIVFSGLGGKFLYDSNISALYDWHQMKNWVAVDAYFNELELSDDQLTLSYRYNFLNRQFQGSRIAPQTDIGGIGDFNQKFYRQHVNKFQKEQAISIWVDESLPQNSVISRDIRWWPFVMVTAFCSLFIIVGLGILYVLIKSLMDPDYLKAKPKKKTSTLQEQYHRNLTWQNHKPWQTPFIRSNARSVTFYVWLAAIFWNAVSSPVLFNFLDEWQDGNYGILIALLFPLIGIWLIHYALKQTIAFIKFGKVELEMTPYPGSVGGQVGARLNIKNLNNNKISQYVDQFDVVLECGLSHVRKSNGKSQRVETVKWAQKGKPIVTPAQKGINLAFCYDVPSTLPTSELDKSDDYHFWRVKITSDLPGIDFNRMYYIPVFDTGRKSTITNANISKQNVDNQKQLQAQEKSSISQGDLTATNLKEAIKISDIDGKLTLRQSMLRHKAVTVFSLIFSLGFGFASTSILSGFSFGSLIGIGMALFSLPFLLVALSAMVVFIYYTFHNRTTVIKGGQLSVHERLLFIPIKRCNVDFSQIALYDIKNTSSSGAKENRKEYFKIYVTIKGGDKVTLCDSVESEALATEFKDYLKNRLKY